MASRTPTELNENWGTDYGIGLGDFFSDTPNGLLERGLSGDGASGLPGSPRLSSSEWDLTSECLGQDPEMSLESDLNLGTDMSPVLTASLLPTNDSLIADHSWLENAFQDPERLPRNSNNKVPELQKLWGNRSTGVVRIDSKDREQVLQDRLSQPADDDPFNIDKISKQKNIKSLIAGAMRKSASNVPLKAIAQELYEKSGHDIESIKPAFKAIQAEHGLVGNVYIRASAYPNLKGLKKAKTARYLVATSTDQNKQAAQLLGLHLVPSPKDINWKKEAKIYLPLLKDLGKPINTSLSPREQIRQAFLSPSKAPRLTTDPIHAQEDEHEKLSHQELESRLRDFKAPKVELKSIQAQQEFKADKAALTKLGSWVKARLLSKEELQGILSSKVQPHKLIDKVASLISQRQSSSGQYQGEGVSYRDAGLSLRPDYGTEIITDTKAKKAALQERKKVFEKIGGMVRANLITEAQAHVLKNSDHKYSDILRIAEMLSTKGKSGDYSGHGNEATKLVHVPHDQVRASLDQAKKRAKFKSDQEKLAAQDKELTSKVSLIEKSLHSGIHGQKLASLISTLLTPEEGERVKHKLNPLILKYNALGTKTAKSQQYSGSTYTEFRGEGTASRVTDKDISNVVKLASQQMNLGLAGEKLDQALNKTVNPALLKEASPKLVQIRKKHEGLAGYAYVDPTAYSTKTIKGCENGAKIHKNSNISYVLAMPKCGTCIANVNHFCGKYKKRLITQVPHDDIQGFKTANIKKSNLAQIDEETFFAEEGGYLDEYGMEVNEDGFTFSFDDKPTTDEDISLTFGGMVL